MQVSVALCTYNGQKYITQQLESILNQSVLPNEIIICDDNSADNTCLIINNLIEKTSVKITLIKNKIGLGTTKNFEKALKLCNNEIIFLADQDDIWRKDKIELSIKYFLENPAKKVLFTDADLVDEKGQKLGVSLWNQVRFDDQTQNEWKNGNEIDVLIKGNRVTGCTVAVKKEFIERIIPFPENLISENFIHDTWLSWFAASEGTIGFLTEPLVDYRQHPQQQIGAIAQKRPRAIRFYERIFRKNQTKRGVYLKQANYFAEIEKMLKPYFIKNHLALQKIERAKLHYEQRGNLSRNFFKRFSQVYDQTKLGNYTHFQNPDSKWFTPYLTILGDIFE